MNFRSGLPSSKSCLGVQISVSYTEVDANEVEGRRPPRPIEDSGIGLGVAAIVGIDFTIGDRFALYGEVSAGADVVWIDDENRDNQGLFSTSGRIGGGGGVAGAFVSAFDVKRLFNRVPAG